MLNEQKTRWSPRTRMQTRSKSYICPNDTLAGHSCGTLLWVTLVGNSCGTLLWDTPVGHSCGILVWDTLAGHSCGTLVGHSARRACRTRLPPKVTRQVSKTSVSYETSSKSHTSSLQNERFVRDFLKTHTSKSAKRAFCTSSFAIPAPPTTSAHTPIPM